MHNRNFNPAGLFAALPAVFVLGVLSAWVTHVIWIIAQLASDFGATTGQIVLGLIGAFMPPVGVIHGLMIWLGMGL